MKNIYPVLLVIQLLLLIGCSVEPVRELPAPVGLLCELLREPADAVITDSIPEFGWIFPAEGKVQTSYRILVASSPGLLEEGKADLWDSGFVPSSGSINVPYRGKPLEPGMTCHWKVRVRGTGNAFSPYSEPQQFHTGRFSGRNPEWPGQSRYLQLDDGRWASENRQTATFETLEPVQFVHTPAGHWFADFGKAAFGTLEIDLQVTTESAFLEVYLGERSNPDGTVNKEPGDSNIGFRKIEATLAEGDHTWRVELPPHESRYPHSQRLAPFYPEVMPFRYVEIRGLPGRLPGPIRLLAHRMADAHPVHGLGGLHEYREPGIHRTNLRRPESEDPASPGTERRADQHQDGTGRPRFPEHAPLQR